MNLEQSKNIFNEIVDLCYETENPQLIEVVSPIVREVYQADDLADVIRSCEELQVFLGELDFLPEEEESVQDVNELIERLSE